MRAARFARITRGMKSTEKYFADGKDKYGRSPSDNMALRMMWQEAEAGNEELKARLLDPDQEQELLDQWWR